MGYIDDATQLQGLITDIQLGAGPNGWEVARHARTKFANLPVVYVSGDSAADWTAEGVPCSIMLQKPYADAQILTAIASLLNEAGPITDYNNPNYSATSLACRDSIFAAASQVSATYMIDVSDWVTPANKDTVFDGYKNGPHPIDAGHAIYGHRAAISIGTILSGL